MTDLDPRRYILDARTTSDPAVLVAFYRAVIRSSAPMSLVAEVAEAYAERSKTLWGFMEGVAQIWGSNQDLTHRLDALCEAMFDRPALRQIFRVKPFYEWSRHAWERAISYMYEITHSDPSITHTRMQAKELHAAYLAAFSDLNPFTLAQIPHATWDANQRYNTEQASYFWTESQNLRWTPRRGIRGAVGQMMTGSPLASPGAIAAQTWHILQVPSLPHAERTDSLDEDKPLPIMRIGTMDQRKWEAVHQFSRACMDAGMYIPSLTPIADFLSPGCTQVVTKTARDFVEWWFGGLWAVDEAFALPYQQGTASDRESTGRTLQSICDVLPHKAPSNPPAPSIFRRALARIKDPLTNPLMHGTNVRYQRPMYTIRHPIAASFVAIANDPRADLPVFLAVSPSFYWTGTTQGRPSGQWLTWYRADSAGNIVSPEYAISDWNEWQLKATE